MGVVLQANNVQGSADGAACVQRLIGLARSNGIDVRATQWRGFVAAGTFALAASVSPSAHAEDESIVIERDVRELGKNAAAKEPADKAKAR